jgi:hypothetical protein
VFGAAGLRSESLLHSLRMRRYVSTTVLPDSADNENQVLYGNGEKWRDLHYAQDFDDGRLAT